MIKITHKEVVEEFDAAGNLMRRVTIEEITEENKEPEEDINQIRIEGFQ